MTTARRTNPPGSTPRPTQPRVVRRRTRGLSDVMLDDMFPNTRPGATTSGYIAVDGARKDVGIKVETKDGESPALLGRMFVPAGRYVRSGASVSVVSLGLFPTSGKQDNDVYVHADFLSSAEWLHGTALDQLVNAATPPVTLRTRGTVDLTLPERLGKVTSFRVDGMLKPAGYDKRVPVHVMVPRELPRYARADAKRGILTGRFTLEGMGSETAILEFLALYYLRGGFGFEVAAEEEMGADASASTSRGAGEKTIEIREWMAPIFSKVQPVGEKGGEGGLPLRSVVLSGDYDRPKNVSAAQTGLTFQQGVGWEASMVGQPIWVDTGFVPAVKRVLAKRSSLQLSVRALVAAGGSKVFSLGTVATGRGAFFVPAGERLYLTLRSQELDGLIRKKIRASRRDLASAGVGPSRYLGVSVELDGITFPCGNADGDLLAYLINGNAGFTPVNPRISLNFEGYRR